MAKGDLQIAKELILELGLDLDVSALEEPPHLTDAGNAKMLYLLHGRNIRYCWPWECWLVWREVRWVQDDSGLIPWCARDVSARYHEMAADVNATVPDLNNRAAAEQDPHERKRLAELALKANEIAGAYTAWAKQCESNQRIDAMIRLARSEEGITILPEQLDHQPDLVNFPNGTLDLQTGELRKHRREDYLTRVAAAPYIPDARHEWVDNLLERAFPSPETRDWFLEQMDRGLAARPPDRVTVIIGPGGTGKTTLTEGLLRALGDYAISVRMDTLVVRRFPGSPDPDLARLAGKRFVFVPEAEGGVQVLDLLKMLTGGTSTPTRNLWERTSQFVPQFALVLSANKRPALPDDDSGARRRLKEIEFSHRFPDVESIRDELTEPAIAGPAWLALVVAAHRRWREAGSLPEPEDVVRSTRNYWLAMGDPQRYFDERTAEDPDAATPFAVLYADYVVWAEGLGLSAPFRRRRPGQYLGPKAFAQELKRRFPRVNSGGRMYKGITLRDPDAPRQAGLVGQDVDAEVSPHDGAGPDEHGKAGAWQPTEGWHQAEIGPSGHPEVPRGAESHINLQTGEVWWRMMSSHSQDEEDHQG